MLRCVRRAVKSGPARLTAARFMPVYGQLGKFAALPSTLKPQARTMATSTTRGPHTDEDRSHFCGTLRSEMDGEQVSLYGWLEARRRFDSMFFGLVSDWSGPVQVVWHQADAQGAAAEAFDRAFDCPVQSVVHVVGRVRRRPADQANPEQPTGDIEVVLEQFHILNPSKRVPISMIPRIESHTGDAPTAKRKKRSLGKAKRKIGKGDNVDPVAENTVESRLRYRYLDLRTARGQRILRQRADITRDCRTFMWDQGFIEVETPILFKSTPEGAAEFLVPSHKWGLFYALPQSPQQFKQLLMVGGVDKYFQIARCFRDEGGRIDRQPEFTQVDIEVSFQSREFIMRTVEGLVRNAVRGALKLELPPIPIMTWKDALNFYGSDKPDTRFQLKLCDITEAVRQADRTMVSSLLGGLSPHGCVKAIKAPGLGVGFSNQDKANLEAYAVKGGAKGALVFKVEENEGELVVKLPPSAVGLMQEPVWGAVLAQLGGLQAGDVVAVVADADWHKACSVLGALRLHLANTLRTKGLLEEKACAVDPLWVVDFPLFEIDEEKSTICSAHHPFTAPDPAALPALRTIFDSMPKELNKVEKFMHLQSTGQLHELTELRGQSFDLVVNGQELGGGSIRIHDASLQRLVLSMLGANEKPFVHLLEALTLGCPPHGGMALGLDRLVACLASRPGDALALRDVIAFPKSMHGNDLTVMAPSPVTRDQLLRYNLRSNKSIDNEPEPEPAEFSEML